MATDWEVRVAHLSFARGSRKIFDDVSFEIARGEVVAVMGPSGTGKTTLMRLLTGQLRPDAGTVEVLGESVPDLSRSALMRLRRRMSMLFQSGALFSDMSARCGGADAGGAVRRHGAAGGARPGDCF